MKAFDRDLFEKYDEPAREATRSFITSKGWAVKDHPDIYSHDLVATQDGDTLLVECEVKVGWRRDPFPFDTVQLPARKRKFFHPNAVFFIWRCDLGNAVYFWARDIEHLGTVQLPNKYTASTEEFFQVPLSLVRFVNP